MYIIKDNVLVEYIENKSETTVIIPDGVIEIGSYAFDSCLYIEKVVFPNSLEKICNNAFDSCVGLKDIVLPNNVYYIGENAFVNCSDLESITFNSDVYIAGNALENCSKLSFYCKKGSAVEIYAKKFDIPYYSNEAERDDYNLRNYSTDRLLKVIELRNKRSGTP